MNEPVKVASARNEAEADLLRDLLAAQGVPSMTRRTAGFDVPDFLSAGPRDVLVPAAAAGRAHDVLHPNARRITMSDFDLNLGGEAALRPAPERTRPSARVRLYLSRGLLALVWAIAFAAVSDSLTTGAGVLLVAYPLIDVVASLVDARGEDSRTLLRFNGAVSALAAIALAIAATGDVADVLRVFGAWAVVSGAAQLAVAVRRRSPESGGQWPMLIAGGLSVLVGIYYNAVSAVDDPDLGLPAVYAAGGGIWFILQAGALALRQRKGRS